MKLTTPFIVLILVLGSSLAHAAADAPLSDRLSAQMESTAAYAKERGDEVPPIKEYAYGMKLDVARVVSVTARPVTCNAVPMLMSYEDSAGALNTVKYFAMGKCS